MAIQSMQLDPNAASYTDDEIVGKINTATADITRASAVNADAVFDGTTNKAYTGTEKTKLGTIEDSATVDQTGDEVITAINAASTAITREAALDQDSLNVVKTNPIAGEFSIKNIHRDASGKMDIEYDDVAV